MVSEEILGGLKAALNRGESLRQAMMSFYNAGYKKEEIEEAAKALHEQESEQPIQQTQPVQQIKPKPKEIPSQPVKTVQRVSNYEKKPGKPEREWLLFIMIFILLVLLGILASIFFFRSELIEFFNNLF